MATFTTLVRNICEYYAGLDGSAGLNDVGQVITNAVPQIFNFDFPIYDESHREELEKKILYHYYMYEIGSETVGLWKLRLQTKLNEIMPYYNQLYASAALEFDPFKDVNYTRSGTRNNDGFRGTESQGTNSRTGKTDNNQTASADTTQTTTTDNNQTTTTDTTNAYSDTPQGGLSNVKNLSYLTNATVIDDSVTTEGETNLTDTTQASNTASTQTTNTDSAQTSNTEYQKIQNQDTYSETVSGKMGTTDYSTLLQRYRDTILNIDMMIVNDLAELFYLYWRVK